MPTAGRSGRRRVVGPELAAAPLVSLSLAALRAGIVLLLIVAGGAMAALLAPPPALLVAPPPVVPPPLLVPPPDVVPDVLVVLAVLPDPLTKAVMAVMPTWGIVAMPKLAAWRGLASTWAAVVGALRAATVDMGTEVL